ncbi:polyprotein [Sesamum angolense]|uniref:Polyprotein n=1 Tax=Sesamum angolense TaxID=2727404 RepID=A0AAE1T9Z9_9LAMI|nr:polyprotein [Sesamum angolense]
MEQDRYKVTKPLPVYSPFTSQPLFTTQPLFGESPPPSPPDYSKYFLMASDIPTDLPKAPPKHPRKKYTPEEKQKAPQTSTPPASQQYASDTLMITKSKPEVYPEIPEPFVTPSTESYETPSEPEPPKVTEPIYPYEKEDEDTECASLEDSDIISEGSKDSEARLADITSILIADAKSSCQLQEQVAKNIEGEESDSDPETTEPTILQPDVSNTKPVAGLWFTFDDVPVIKRRERLHTFSAWIDLQLTREGATLSKKLQVLLTGLKYKRYFQPFSTIPRIFAITDAPAPYADIVNKLNQCCADSHANFKHPHPLWKNPEFFIQLPFKLNEDANPIKASHPGMTPDDLVLAREECNQLLERNQIGLVQLSMSTKELNKSEGKRGFWQLGIDPKDRYKTAFCLPNAQYQWTVMPFGLKPTHEKLLQQFCDIIQAHGVMLSDKKSFIGQPNIDFLGMKFIDGRYQPGPHITQELLKFPEENLTTKEIQQFLGIVNYIKDFIPECSRYTSQLSKLLKKEPPPWGQAQTMALQKLKQVCQQPLPLKIPSTGHRILETDACNEFWGAILIEEENGKKHFCGHASGQFKDSEKHYHAVYKEILAIKYGIKKFEFHLIGHISPS